MGHVMWLSLQQPSGGLRVRGALVWITPLVASANNTIKMHAQVKNDSVLTARWRGGLTMLVSGPSGVRAFSRLRTVPFVCGHAKNVYAWRTKVHCFRNRQILPFVVDHSKSQYGQSLVPNQCTPPTNLPLRNTFAQRGKDDGAWSEQVKTKRVSRKGDTSSAEEVALLCLAAIAIGPVPGDGDVVKFCWFG